MNANFGESPECEVRRIPIPRTPVNKGKKRRAGVCKPRPSTCAIPERLVDRWVRAPAGSAIPDCALCEVHRAHHLSVLDQKTKHVRVALFAIACCAPRSDPALSVREARREARAAVLLIGILVGECVQARAIRVCPIEV